MARKSKKKNEIVLSKDNLLIQPLALTLAGVNPTVIGNRVSVAIVRRLQNAFKEIISERRKGKDWQQLSIFATDEVKKNYLGDNKISFDIHMNELVDDPKHYQFAFDAICRLSDIKIFVPIKGEGEETAYARVSLFETVFGENVEVNVPYKVKGEKSEIWYNEKMSFHDYLHIGNRNPKRVYFTDKMTYSYQKNTKPIMGITVERIVAEYIFSFQKKYGDFLDYTAVSTNDKYYTPIYIFIASYKYNGSIEMDYMEFRQKVLGLEADKPYPEFFEFNRRILKPCMDEMKRQAECGASDCYFDYEKIYNDGKRATNPDRLKFNIHLSELGKAIKDEKVNTKEMMGVERRLREQFDQTATQTRNILKGVPLNMRAELVRKMNLLETLEKQGKIVIDKDRRSYFNASFSAFVEEIRQSDNNTIPFPTSEQSVKTNEQPDTADRFTPEQQEQFALFLQDLRGRVGEENAKLLSPVRLSDIQENLIVLSVPTATLGQLIIDRFCSAINEEIVRYFGEEARWKFVVKQ